MTRAELTHTRDLSFSGWIRENLPDSSFGFMATDLDFILYNFQTKKLMLLEVKTRNAELKQWQRNLFDNVAKWIAKGIDQDWSFLGFHIIRFEHTFFNDGKVYLDNELITEEGIRNYLSRI